MAGTQQTHPFHLVNPSPWPLFASLACLVTTTGGVMFMHRYEDGVAIFLFGLSMIIYAMFVWWRDIIREATFEGYHTIVVQKGLRFGVILFIVSEVFFFLAFFWAFFHSSLVPTVELGAIWPPKGIQPFDPWAVPLVNTAILLLSGATVTWAHHAIVAGKKGNATIGLFLTVALGLIFTGLQAFEYIEAPFDISDGVYGSTFYLATGFHGIHVIVGTIFLIVCLVRQMKSHFTKQHHFGFEAAAFY